MFLLDEIREFDRSKKWNPTFQMLHFETRELVDGKTQKASRLPQNRSLNRYRDVLPYDDTRVKLKTSSNDYVNASYVEALEVNRRYILAQGPLPNTCGDFWRMIWENNSQAIVMLNRIIEKNMIKCHPYWPMGEEEILEFDEFQITNQITQTESSYLIRELIVTNTNVKQSRKVVQYHFTVWPDFGVPHDPQSFLDFLKDIKQNNFLSNPDAPTIVHCSAGIGRSGTFCLIDTTLALAERNIDQVNIRGTLLSLRKCRCGLVQTTEQYRFANVTILKGLHELYPNIIKDQIFEEEDDDGEPPPLPPRRTKPIVPPTKPPRAVESEEPNPNKISNDVTASESSDYESSDEEIIDLSDSSLDEELGTKKPEVDYEEPVDVKNEEVHVSTSSLVGSKASENKDLRQRIREMKHQKTRELVGNIKRNMKESEDKSSSKSMLYLLYAGAAVLTLSGLCFVIYHAS